MNRFCSFAILFVALLALHSCGSMPDHARYIPKDALVVAGLNTKEIGKKIAWNAIMGNKLLEEMQKDATGGAITDPSEIGIEMMSTSYVYVKDDARFTNGSRVTALVPLDDVQKWEAFVEKSFPGAVVKKNDGYKEAQLAEGMYAGWTDNLLTIMNTLEMPTAYVTTDSAAADTAIVQTPPPAAVPDATELAAEMKTVFSMQDENAITDNKRFTKMEEDFHDITLWINYDRLMSKMNMGNMMGISLSNSLWKDAALSAGFDFEKGKITGDILYYLPENMKQVGEELGKTDADKELAERMPDENLDMLMTWHLSPKGVKGLLEKTGVLGFINLALMGQDLSVDYILEAFTGDMAVALNDFTLKTDTTGIRVQVNTDSSRVDYSPDIHFTYALKIGKKENFNKLMQLAAATGSLTAMGNGTYTLKTADMPATIAINDKYCVISNLPGNAKGYLDGTFRKQAKPDEAKDILGNPFGIYFNAQGMMNGVGVLPAGSNPQLLAESKKLLKDVQFKGGSFKSDAFAYSMSINFVDGGENSLLQLIDFALHMGKAQPEALATVK